MLGLSTNTTLAYLDRTKAKQIEMIQSSAMHKKAIADFRKNISNINSAEDLIKDYKTYSFAMKAFDLESQIFGKAMMRKVFESDAEDPKSLVNRLTDSKIKEMYNFFGFEDNGKTNPNTKKEDFADAIIQKYLETQFENKQYETNDSVGNALYARRKAPQIKNWYNVLADKQLTEFFRTALSLPDNLTSMPIEKQKTLLEKKFDITKLKDDKELNKLVVRYGALADAKKSMENMNSGLTGIGALINPSSIIAIDLSSIGYYSIGKYSKY